MPVDEVRKVFETNYLGVIRTSQAMIPLLKNSDNPVITNVSSEMGSITSHSNPDWEYYNFKGIAYSPSKSALNMLTVVMAYQLKESGIKVNSINPGYTATEFNHYRGTRGVKDAAKDVINFSLIDKDGPTGKFLTHGGELLW